MQPKTSAYQSDGTGRDSYIGINSGGFEKKFKPLCNVFNVATNLNRVSDMKFRVKKNHPSDLKIINKAIKYAGDGNGRDSYVIVDYGGSVKKHKSRHQLLKEYTENKIAAQHNRTRSQKSFTGMPNFTTKRPEFQGNVLHKIHSQGNVLKDINNPYPPQVSVNRANTVAEVQKRLSQGGNKFGYDGNWTAQDLPRHPFKHSQSLDPRKWQQILSKAYHFPHTNY